MSVEGRMSLLSFATVLSLVDSMAIVLSQAYLSLPKTSSAQQATAIRA